MLTVKDCRWCPSLFSSIANDSLLLQEWLECLVVPHEHNIATVEVDKQRAGKPTQDPARDTNIQWTVTLFFTGQRRHTNPNSVTTINPRQAHYYRVSTKKQYWTPHKWPKGRINKKLERMVIDICEWYKHIGLFSYYFIFWDSINYLLADCTHSIGSCSFTPNNLLLHHTDS